MSSNNSKHTKELCLRNTPCPTNLTTQNIQKNFVLGILHVLPTTQTMQPQKPAPVCSASQTDALDNATTQTDARALDVDWLRSVSQKSKYDVRRNIPDNSPNLIVRTGTALRFRELLRRLQMSTREYSAVANMSMTEPIRMLIFLEAS